MANRVANMDRKRNRAQRAVGYECLLADGNTINVWVSQDELDMEFHGLDLKKVCRLGAERASAQDIEKGELTVSRELLIEVEERELIGGQRR
jgi:predicted secreted protein